LAAAHQSHPKFAIQRPVRHAISPKDFYSVSVIKRADVLAQDRRLWQSVKRCKNGANLE